MAGKQAGKGKAKKAPVSISFGRLSILFEVPSRQQLRVSVRQGQPLCITMGIHYRVAKLPIIGRERLCDFHKSSVWRDTIHVKMRLGKEKERDTQ